MLSCGKSIHETQVEAFSAQPFSFVKSHFQANKYNIDFDLKYLRYLIITHFSSIT